MDTAKPATNDATLSQSRTAPPTDLSAQLYADLRVIARNVIKNRGCPGLLQTTALMNEAWIRLRPYQHLERLDSLDAFHRVAATIIRSVLVDEARREDSDKRGGRWRRISISVDVAAPDHSERWIDLLDLHAALQKLAGLDEQRASIVEMRFFGGLNMPEIAKSLGISLRTAESEWQLARAWLRAHLERTSRGDDS